MSVRPENNYRHDESLHNTFQIKGTRIRGGDCLRNICDGKGSTVLQNKLKEFKDKLYVELEKKKHKKLSKFSPSLSEISNTQNQWIPDSSLTNQDRLNIWNNEEINDFIILQTMNLLQKQYPTITTEPPSLHFQQVIATVPAKLKITHTWMHHWTLLSWGVFPKRSWGTKAKQ